VLKHYFRPKREEFREALETALPQSLTGGKDMEKEAILKKPAELESKLAA